MASEWDTHAHKSGNNYDVNDFYTASTDGRGHYEEVRAKLPPGITNQISELIAQKQLPYRTVGDFIRDSVVHRAHHLNEALENGELAYEIEFMIQYDQAEAARKRLEREQDLVRNRISILNHGGLNGAMPAFIDQCKVDIKLLKYDQPRHELESAIERFA